MITKYNRILNSNCLIYNYAQHYRLGVFQSLDNHLEFDFYFGDKMGDVKKMNYDLLSNFRHELKNIKLIGPVYWQAGATSLLFKKYNNYLILGEYYCISTWMILLFSQFYKKKKVYLWTHGWYGNEGFIKKVVKKLFFNLSDGVLLYGNYAKSLMVKNGFDKNKLKVIYNSLEYHDQLRVRKKLRPSSIYRDHFKNNDPVLIFIGRLTPVKKLNLLLEAQALLLKEDHSCNVVFIGDGVEKEFLSRVADENKLIQRVWFYGKTYNEEEIGKLIYNADICVSPGNVGLTAMHSLMFGTPVITHSDFSNQMPEFEAIQEGLSGSFFEKDNVEDLARKVKKWLKMEVDREFVRKDCYDRIDHFYNPEKQVTLISEFIE